MRAWSLIRLRAISRTRPAIRPAIPLQAVSSQRHYIKALETAPAPDKGRLVRKHAGFDSERPQSLFEKVEYPGNDIESWTALLDGGLPPHLRNWDESSALPPNLSAADVAEVLLAARNLSAEDGGPLDLLYHLGFVQNRWNAVIWLVKRLVEKFPARHGQPPRLARVNAMWAKLPTLDDLVQTPIDLNLEASVPPSGMVEARSLRDLLTGLHPETMSREEILRHDALGEIWLVLGSMIKACAEDGETKPEVLEIIAYLHHKGVMPLSIYQPEPPADKSAIHQPPLLSMLSSRILTSLSDAAWRAHERMVIEEAKAQAGDYASLRPEIPGSVYRTHVAGLRPEVWMELILWSCLHGGWIKQGAAIMEPLGARGSKWRVFSWREYEDIVASDADGNSNPWNDLEYAFKTRASTARDAAREPGLDVTRTVSAEVVNAFIDALIINVNVGVGERGIEVEHVIQSLHKLKALLNKFSDRSSPSTGSWDSLVLRLVESRSMSIENDSDLVKASVRLSPGLGQGLVSKNTQDLPGYVFDGSMAMPGLLHRALHGQIVAGSFEGAWAIFQLMQFRADKDKSRSIESFMRGKGRQSLLESLTKGKWFTSNLTGIEYPAFDLQIPATTLGSFLELATDAQAYDFGRWLLYNDDVDGPVIPESLYNDPHIQPAVVRFAAEAADNQLLSKFMEMKFERQTFTYMFDSQVNQLRWDSAERILQHLADTRGDSWNIHNLSNLVRVMLQQVPGAARGDADCQNNLNRAKALVAGICGGRYDLDTTVGPRKYAWMKNLIAVICAVNSEWRQFFARYHRGARWQEYDLGNKDFNAIMQGVATAYGSAEARRLLGMFWPHSARRAYDASFRITKSPRSRWRMAQFRPSLLEALKRTRIVIPGLIRGADGWTSGIVYGACVPNTATIMIILRKALEEARSAASLDSSETPEKQEAQAGLQDKSVDKSPRGMVVWGVRRLLELRNVDERIVQSIGGLLSELGLEDVRDELRTVVRNVKGEIDALEDPDAPDVESEADALDNESAGPRQPDAFDRAFATEGKSDFDAPGSAPNVKRKGRTFGEESAAPREPDAFDRVFAASKDKDADDQRVY
ncbi:hypothetical protein PRZ48_015025 [Zasmidium cellare]|uniref:Uncharacterized protein n=1 Tax=Zasmidium cellare TaxID=395010 RepID=A0ABR0DXW9_ZASCE|nr:hypothetical protein PRZ48_015025 [Zasmidium cellare]